MTLNSQTVAYRVIQSVAEYDDTNLLNLPPLCQTIDPDALEACIQTMNEGKIKFEYADHSVTVNENGIVDVSDSSPRISNQVEKATDD